MSFTHAHRQTLFGSGVNIEASQNITAELIVAVDQSIPAASTNLELAFSLDVSQIKSIFMLSDLDLTVKTSSSGSPVDTISLVAGVPYIWTEDSYDPLLLSADVTKLFVTNADADDAASLQIQALADATP